MAGLVPAIVFFEYSDSYMTVVIAGPPRSGETRQSISFTR
jgi:hypothetical protein